MSQNPTDMPLDIAYKSIDFLVANARQGKGKTPQVTFFGGEPTLFWEQIIVPTVNYAKYVLGEKVNFSITSNCLLMTEDRLEWMKKENVGLLFSIDGDKHTQDYNRCFHDGSGSFDRLENIIYKIPRYFPNTIFRSTVVPATCEHVFHNIMFAKNAGYKTIYVIPNVFERWNEKDIRTLKEQLGLYGDYYIESYRKGKSPDIRLAPFEKSFGKLWRIMNSKGHRNTKNCAAEGKCGFCTGGSASIDPHGNIYACQELPSSKGTEDIFYVGDIFSGVDDARRQKLINAYDIKKVRGLLCEDCSLNNICDGGCVANNYLISGDLNKIPEMYCIWNQMLIDEGMRVANILGDEKNEKFKKSFVGFVKGGGYGL